MKNATKTRETVEKQTEYGAVPVVGLGHSCGSLLHVLITSLFPDTPRAANALLSYNNRAVGDAVPFFEELVVPLFSDRERNGSGLMRAAMDVAREKFSGEFVVREKEKIDGSGPRDWCAPPRR